MTYLHNHNRDRVLRTRIMIGVSVGVVLVIAMTRVALPNFFSGLFTSIVRPFWRTEFAIESGSLQSVSEILRMNADLKRQLDDMAVQMSDVSALRAENSELKALMGRASTTPFILGAVLMRPPYSGYDRLVIDVGADHGLVAGDKVYAEGPILIGTVTSVLGETAIVTLYSSPGQSYQVLIGASHAPATAMGRGGGQYQAQLPRESRVAAGDFVISPSLDERSFGVVASVNSDPAQPFETVFFAPAIDIYGLRWVLIKK